MKKLITKPLQLSPGIVFNNEHPYIVDHVIADDCSDLPEIDIQKGDELISVDGVKTDDKQNREFYFMRSEIPDEMVLGFRRGSKTFKVKIHPSSAGQTQEHLYDEWIDANRQRVDALSQQPDRLCIYERYGTQAALNKFELKMVSDSINQRKGLILDLRYNTGGNVHDKVLKFLSQLTLSAMEIQRR